MKPGDLVTLSASGVRLGALRDWYGSWARNKLVGTIVGIYRPPPDHSDWRPRIRIRWIGKGPDGREYWCNYFHRGDLKFVNRA